MRVVIDTNVLISALLSSASRSALLLSLWRRGRFDLVTSREQLDEMRRVTRYPKLRRCLRAAVAGRLVNDLRSVATMVEARPIVARSNDPDDDYLLALAAAATADVLVTGDKRDLLGLTRHEGVRIMSVTEFLRSIKEHHP